MRQAVHVVVAVLGALLVVVIVGGAGAFSGGCGVAPVQHGEVPGAPPSWRYLGQHGRPLAYRGGVCAIEGPHEHKYPPAPSGSFIQTANGWADTRPIVPFVGRHPHRGRTCTEAGWHLHLEEPDPVGLVFDEGLGAWRAEPPLPG